MGRYEEIDDEPPQGGSRYEVIEAAPQPQKLDPRGRPYDPRFAPDDEKPARPIKNTGPDAAGQLRADAAALAQPSYGELAARRVGDVARSVAAAVPEAVDLVSPVSRTGGLQVPFGKLADPAYRRQVERGLSDVVTGGFAEALANKVSPEFAASAQADEAAAPGARNMAQVAGAAVPSPFTKTGGAAARAIPGTGALASTARGVAAYEAAALPLSGVHGAVQAEPGQRLEGALASAAEAAVDPAGLVLSGGLPLAANAAKGGARAIQGAAKNSERRMVDRKAADLEEGSTKPAKAKLREANPELIEALHENPAVRDAITSKPTQKTDAKLSEAVKQMSKKASAQLDEIYSGEHVGDRPPPAAKSASRERGPDIDLDELLAAGDGSAPASRLPGPGGTARAHDRLLARAISAEAEAAKLMKKADTHARKAEEFVNPEMAAKEAKNAAIAEIMADEARARANKFRSEVERLKGGPPPGRPRESVAVEPDLKLPPVREKAGSSKTEKPPARGIPPEIPLRNLDERIAKLESGDVNDRTAARRLKGIRDEFAEAAAKHGDRIPAKALRAEQSAYQRNGYAKNIQNDPEVSATILANREASKAVGDAVIRHVTGMSYEDALLAAKKDPNSLAGKLMKANAEVSVANRMQAVIDGRKGSNPGSPHRFSRIMRGAGAIGATAAAVGSGSVLPLAVAGGLYVAPKLPRMYDSAMTKLAPRAPGAAAKAAAAADTAAVPRLTAATETDARASRGPVSGVNDFQLARLLQVARSGASPDEVTQAGLGLGLSQDVAERTAEWIAGARLASGAGQ